MLCQHFHPNSQHSRVYNETVKFHHKLKLGMLRVEPEANFFMKKKKMQFLYKTTNKEAKLVIIVVIVPKLLGLLNTAGTLVCNINQSLWEFGKKAMNVNI